MSCMYACVILAKLELSDRDLDSPEFLLKVLIFQESLVSICQEALLTTDR